MKRDRGEVVNCPLVWQVMEIIDGYNDCNKH